MIILAGLPHLFAQPGLPLLSIQPMLHLLSLPGKPHLLVLVGLLLVCPGLAHWRDSACLLTFTLVFFYPSSSAHLCTYIGLTHLLSHPDFSPSERMRTSSHSVRWSSSYHDTPGHFASQYSLSHGKTPQSSSCADSHQSFLVWTPVDRDCSHSAIHPRSSHHRFPKDGVDRGKLFC